MRRYGVTLVRERAVLLLDAVGFSLHTPLEQVAMLNSLSYSINSALQPARSEDVQINFARTTTGDGFYIWNRAKSRRQPRALQAHDADPRRQRRGAQQGEALSGPAAARRVPRRRALRVLPGRGAQPDTFGYIVGQVTIELARMLEKARPGQILLGDFEIEVNNADGVPQMPDRRLHRPHEPPPATVAGLAVANDRIADIRCYVTGNSRPDGGFEASRYLIEDKHGRTRPVYNAKINLHLEGERADLPRPAAPLLAPEGDGRRQG